MQRVLTDLLFKRKQRCIATVLSSKEALVDQHLSQQESDQFRKVILDEINGLFDLVLDVTKGIDDKVEWNQHYLDMLQEIHVTVTGNGSGNGDV